MRFARYAFDDGAGLAAVLDDGIVDLRDRAPQGLKAALLEYAGALARLAEHAGDLPRVPLAQERLLAPIPDPGAFIAVGLNYRDHAAQMGRPLPEQPAVFAKLTAAIAAPYGIIARDPRAPSLDYEAELAFVIGRRCRHVSVKEAAAAIAGYMIVNDVTVRARVSPDTVMWAKGGVGHAPCGPWLVSADAIADPQQLGIRTWVNGELRQDGTTADMNFSCAELVAWLSRGLTLMPGDIVTTGSPAGTGASLTPPSWLVPGDRVRIEIDQIGAIEQRVEDEA